MICPALGCVVRLARGMMATLRLARRSAPGIAYMETLCPAHPDASRTNSANMAVFNVFMATVSFVGFRASPSKEVSGRSCWSLRNVLIQNSTSFLHSAAGVYKEKAMGMSVWMHKNFGVVD